MKNLLHSNFVEISKKHNQAQNKSPMAITIKFKDETLSGGLDQTMCSGTVTEHACVTVKINYYACRRIGPTKSKS